MAVKALLRVAWAHTMGAQETWPGGGGAGGDGAGAGAGGGAHRLKKLEMFETPPVLISVLTF